MRIRVGERWAPRVQRAGELLVYLLAGVGGCAVLVALGAGAAWLYLALQ